MPYHGKSLPHLKPTHEIVVTRMLFTLGLAATTVGVPLYLIQLGMKDSSIGIFIGIISLLIAIISLLLPPVFEKFNQLRLNILSSIFTGLSFILFSYSNSPVTALLFIFASNLSITINLYSLSILFKDSTRTKQEFTRDTGMMGSLINLSWFIGPLLGGLMLNYAGINGLFILAGALCILSGIFVVILPFKTIVKQRAVIDGNLVENLKFYLSKPMLRIAYFQRMGITLWWGFIWTFIPIFMVRNNYSAASIGLFIGISQLPLFLFEFKTVDILSRVSYRTVFLLSYLFLSLVCLIAFFSPIFSISLFVLFLGSFALSFLEPIIDLFFFDQVSKLEEEKTYPIYGTSSLIGSTAAKIGVGAGLVIFADQAAFIIIAILMLLIAVNATKIRFN